MTYRVDWKPEAERDLAAVWVASDDQAGVSAAAHELEQELVRGPLFIGESRRSSLQRVAFCPPVGFEYEVIPDDARVIIQAVFAVG